MHFTTFIINAVTFAKIKASLRQRHELERALAESQQQAKSLAGLLLHQRECDEPYAPQADSGKPGESRARPALPIAVEATSSVRQCR